MTTTCLIGDSLLAQNLVPGTGQSLGPANVTTILSAAGYPLNDINIHAVGGKSLLAADTGGTTTLQDIAAARVALGHVDQWWIALGTNREVDTGDAAAVTALTNAVQTILDAIGNEGRVTWCGLAYKGAGNTNAGLYNPAIKALVEAKTGCRYADWQNYVHNGRDETNLWLSSDSTHMSQEGYDLKNRWMRDQLAIPWASEWDGAKLIPLKAIEWNGATATPLTWLNAA